MSTNRIFCYVFIGNEILVKSIRLPVALSRLLGCILCHIAGLLEPFCGFFGFGLLLLLYDIFFSCSLKSWALNDLSVVRYYLFKSVDCRYKFLSWRFSGCLLWSTIFLHQAPLYCSSSSWHAHSIKDVLQHTSEANERQLVNVSVAYHTWWLSLLCDNNLALGPEYGVLAMVSYAGTGFGEAGWVLFVMCSHLPWTTSWNNIQVLASMIVGAATVLSKWTQFGGSVMYEIVSAWFHLSLSHCDIMVVSLATVSPDAKLLWRLIDYSSYDRHMLNMSNVVTEIEEGYIATTNKKALAIFFARLFYFFTVIELAV